MFEVRINNNFVRQVKEVYIFEKSFSGRMSYLTGIKNGCIEAKTLEEGESARPLFVLDYNIADDFFRGFMDALNGLDLKTNKDIKIEGTLEATRDHLKDLRQLLKLK